MATVLLSAVSLLREVSAGDCLSKITLFLDLQIIHTINKRTVQFFRPYIHVFLKVFFMRLLVIICWLLIVIFVADIKVQAQQFGGNPSSIKWSQINTDTARIIFPEELVGQGRKVASIVHELQRSHTGTIGNRLRKINIVLQNQTSFSNGYVGLGPFRSEFYLFAPQNSFETSALNWIDELSLHEFRHVQQYNNFNVGLSRLAGILFGQQGRALANNAAVPDWFFEGDAVFNETLLSRQGRGRVPDFFNGFKSLYQQGRHYSYMTIRNGSLRQFVPNHYELGYLLVGYGREKYGADFWRKVSADAATFKSLIYPWQSAVRRHAGISYNQFVSDAFAYYQKQWPKEAKSNFITAPKRGNVVNYKYPYLDSSGNIIALESSYSHIPAFYKINKDGKEQKLAVRDIANDDYFSYNGGKIIYSSFRADKRWGYREYSDIKLLDVATGTKRTLVTKERYFSPDLSHDGNRFIVVEMKPNQESNLVSMNQRGEKVFRSKATRGLIYTYPKFSANDSFIYSPIRNEDGQMALLKLELATGKELRVVPFGNRVLGFPLVQGDTVFFSSSYKGNDEIWAYIERRDKVYRVASRSTGLYQAAYDNTTKRLIASTFTADGYRLISIDQPEQLWQPVNEKEQAVVDLYLPDALKQESSATLDNIPVRDFAVRPYKKSYNIFNFHSWRPYYDESEIAFTLLGENILNTFQSELFYAYNRNEASHRVGFNAIYGGSFFQPLAGVSHTWDRTAVLEDRTELSYNELNVNAGLRLPLNLTSGKQNRFITLSSTFNNQQRRWTGIAKQLLADNNFNYLESRVQYSGQIQKAAKQIYPHWAQSVSLQYRNALDNDAKQFLGSGYLYLPGLFATHNLVLSAAYQARDTFSVPFTNNFPFSRGYTAIDFPRMVRFGSNYHFPLVYPDLGFANIVYFRRIRANGFFDYTVTKSLRTGNTFDFRTTGGEVFFDTKWWNQQEITFGIRYSRLLDQPLRGSNYRDQWEVVLPVLLF